MDKRVLDLFSCGGGAARGYSDAGYAPIGVDKDFYEDYPFPSVQADVIAVLDKLLDGGDVMGYRLADFSAIHASPPCQLFAALVNCRPGVAETYPNLIPPTRERLIRTGLPYIMENVPGSPLDPAVILCGTQFGRRFQLHRLFETNFPVPQPLCDHSIQTFNPESTRGRAKMRAEFPGESVWAIFCREKGITGMRYNGDYKKQAREAISPLFARYIGEHLTRWEAA